MLYARETMTGPTAPCPFFHDQLKMLKPWGPPLWGNPWGFESGGLEPARAPTDGRGHSSPASRK